MGRTRGHIQTEVEEAYEDRHRRSRMVQTQKKNKFQCGPKCKSVIGLSFLALYGLAIYQTTKK